MKKILWGMVAVLIGLTFVSGQAFAISKQYQHKGSEVSTPAKAEEAVSQKPPKEEKHKVRVSDFPEKGWHKGFFVAANVGMMQVTNDYHVVTGRPFDGQFDLAYGLTFGWDVADWIGPMLQINFATKTDQVGDPNNGNNNGAAYPSNPGVTFPANTFPVQNGRQYALDFSLFCRATLPYFTRAEWQPKIVKIIPFMKLGGTGHAVFNSAPTAANMAGAFGGGPAIGAGVEFLIWKGFFVALDFTEHLILQQSVRKTITTNAGPQNFEITKGGFAPQFTLLGLFGWHF